MHSNCLKLAGLCRNGTGATLQLVDFSARCCFSSVYPISFSGSQKGCVTARNTIVKEEPSCRFFPSKSVGGAISFRLLLYSDASLRISFSSAFRFNLASRCFMCLKAAFIFEAGINRSLALMSSKASFENIFRCWSNLLAAIPVSRATKYGTPLAWNLNQLPVITLSLSGLSSELIVV